MRKESIVVIIEAQNGLEKILIADEAVVSRVIFGLQRMVFVVGFLHMIRKNLLSKIILILIMCVKCDPADISTAADLCNGDFLKRHFLQNVCQRCFDIAFRLGDTFIFQSGTSAFAKIGSRGFFPFIVLFYHNRCIMICQSTGVCRRPFQSPVISF